MGVETHAEPPGSFTPKVVHLPERANPFYDLVAEGMI
ncbi:MAG: hypothetical protein QOK29_4128 [Rhodospirillaceae bacterium]|jgi:hypothetical protein|nr:hypothetical protein [Rhodospirillaceae bacterium]